MDRGAKVHQYCIIIAWGAVMQERGVCRRNGHPKGHFWDAAEDAACCHFCGALSVDRKKKMISHGIALQSDIHGIFYFHRKYFRSCYPGI